MITATKTRVMRPDVEIARDVVRAAGPGATFCGSTITCTVRDGFVTLEGSIEWRSQRDNIEACVRRVPGVRGVVNKIMIGPSSGEQTEHTAWAANFRA